MLEMSYFQLAIIPDQGSLTEVRKLVEEISTGGVSITKLEEHPADFPLIGYTAYIDDVDVKSELKWKRIVKKVLRESNLEVDYRFRFKGYSY